MYPQAKAFQHDVIVIGARAAGAATAMLLARAGHDVVMIDRARLPRDTTSTHGLARGAVVQLDRWGLIERVLASGAPAVTKVRFNGETKRIKDQNGLDFLIAPRRIVLDMILGEAAVDAGARRRLETTATGLLRDDTGRVVGVRTKDEWGVTDRFAKLVIGADGVHSRTARWVNAPVIQAGPRGGATFYTYAKGDWDAYEFHLGDTTMAGAFPTHGGAACVYICGTPELTSVMHRAGDRKLEAFMTVLAAKAPDLAARTQKTTEPLRGAAGLPNHVKLAHGPGWALVGDAGYHRDPITGHGITDAFRDAEFLAHAADQVLRGEQAERPAMTHYQARRDHAISEVFGLTKALGTFPGPEAFAGLQKQLSAALDSEARMLSDLPNIGNHQLIPA